MRKTITTLKFVNPTNEFCLNCTLFCDSIIVETKEID